MTAPMSLSMSNSRDWRSREGELREWERLLTMEDADPRVCPQCAFGRRLLCDKSADRVHVGDIIVVPKGAIVETFASRGIFEAGRTYRVKVNHFIGNIPRWAGESGYWTWTQDWRPIDGRLHPGATPGVAEGVEEHS